MEETGKTATTTAKEKIENGIGSMFCALSCLVFSCCQAYLFTDFLGSCCKPVSHGQVTGLCSFGYTEKH